MGNDPDVDLKRAQQLFDVGRAAQAREVAASVLAARPNDPGTLRLLARCHMELGEHREAVHIARVAVAADPGAEHGYLVLSAALRRVKSPQGAANAATEAVRIAPREWQAYAALAQSLYRWNPRRALAAAEEARRLAPENPETHYLCGITLRRLNSDGEARVAFLRALEIDPQHASSLNGMALLDQRRFRIASAERGFRSALSADPQLRVARRNLEVLVLLRLWILGWLAVAGAVVVAAGSKGGAAQTRAFAVGCEAVLLALFAASARSAKKRSNPSGARLFRKNPGVWICQVVIAGSAVLIAIPAVVPDVVEMGAYTTARVSLTLLNYSVFLLMLFLRIRTAAGSDAL